MALTPFEIIGNFDLRLIADDELDAIIKNLSNERTARKETHKKEAWEKLVRQIKKYCEEFGAIDIARGTSYLSENDNYATPGEIR